ncbi:MAG: S41 family peptidase [Candidatus Kerfeldbacteria bacterium]
MKPSRSDYSPSVRKSSVSGRSMYNSAQGTPQPSRTLFITVVMIIVLIVGVGIGYGMSSYDFSTNGSGRFLGLDRGTDHSSEEANFRLFWDVWDEVVQRHVDQPVNQADMLYGAIAGMVAGVGDPYSSYFDPEQSEKFLSEINGSFEGIGAEIGIKDDVLTVIAPLPGSPAELAGLMAGDRILAIDGLDTTFMSLNLAVQTIRGEQGTTVMLTIERKGEDKPLDIEITRNVIQIVSVEWEMIEQDDARIAMITVSHFNSDTAAAFKEAVNEVILQQPDGLILDLRNNVGGFLDASIQIASQFIEEGNVVVYEQDSQNELKPYFAEGVSPLNSINTVVMINGGSASASEILAGALQDYEHAILVGTTSFGKGTVQDFQTFEDGSSLKLTVSRWLTPYENLIEEIGIAPDYYVDRTAEDFSLDLDPQLDAAVLYFSDVVAFTASTPTEVPEEETSEDNNN